MGGTHDNGHDLDLPTPAATITAAPPDEEPEHIAEVPFSDIEDRDVLKLPHDDQAERAVLAGIILNNDLVESAEHLHPGDFHRIAHAAIFQTIQRLATTGIPFDAVAVAGALDATAIPDGIDVRGTLAEVLLGAARSSAIAHHVDRVQSLSRRRNALRTLQDLKARLTNGSTDQAIEDMLLANLEAFNSGRSARTLSPPTDLANPDLIPSKPTWLVEGLFMKGGVHQVWAAPGLAKSLLMQLAAIQLASGAPTLWGVPNFPIRQACDRILYISHEEPADRQKHRAAMICRGLRTTLPAERLFHYFASQDGWRFTLEHLERLLRTHGPFDVVIIDTLTGLRPARVDGQSIKWDLDNDAINALLRPINALARSTGTAVVLIHHANKAGTGFRGGIDLLASVDVSVELKKLADEDAGKRISVFLEKVRDGRDGITLQLRTIWSRDERDETVLQVEPVGEAEGALPIDDKHIAILQLLDSRGPLPQAKIAPLVGLHRNSAREKCNQMEAWKLVAEDGRSNNSVVWAITIEGRAIANGATYL